MPSERPAHPEPHPSQRGILCPYCGSVSASDPKRCDRCGGFFDPLSRQASQNAMGPWFIRDPAAPFRPGCSFETLRELIRRRKVTRETILRGPSTRQYWNFASRTPGVANLLGFCHNCHVAVKSDDFSCAACGAVFSPETDRQHMGLAPVHLLPGQASPEIIAAASVDQARHRPPALRRPATRQSAPAALPPAARASGGARAVMMVLLGLMLVGALGIGIVKFVLPAFDAPPTPPASSPAPPAQEPAAKPEPQQQPTPEAPPRTEPEPVVTPPDGGPSDSQLLAMFLSQPLDGPSLLREIESAPDVRRDAWKALVRQRVEHEHLRSLP